MNLFRLRTVGGIGGVALKSADKGVNGTDKGMGGPLKEGTGKCSSIYEEGARIGDIDGVARERVRLLNKRHIFRRLVK